MNNYQCYLCKNAKIEAIYRLGDRIIYRCPHDNLFFSFDKKIKKNLYDSAYYDSSPYGQSEPFNDRYFEQKLDEIKTLTDESKPTILDAGCGWGNFLQVLQKNQISYIGVDDSPEAVKICKMNKLNVKKIDLLELSQKNSQQFSAITLFQVIEHLKNPVDHLKAAKKLLKKNGVLIITTPNNQSPLRYLSGSHWSIYQTPSHFFFYSVKTLKQILTAAGFKNVKIKVDRFRFFSFGYIWQKLFKKKLSFSLVNNLPVPTDPWGDLEAVAINES